MSHATTVPDHLMQLQSPDGARIAVSLFGGQLCAWQTADGSERLFLGSRAQWNNRQAIRGGVPIIFPQFGAAGTGPRHGFARTLPWTLLASFTDDSHHAVLRLGLTDCATSRQFTEAEFALTVEFRFAGSEMQIALDIANTGTAAFSFCAALHTYLRTDVPTASIHGLQHSAFRDATEGGVTKTDMQPALVIDKEIDRLYAHAPSAVSLRSDTGIIHLSQTGFTDTVVWNPWIEKTSALSDCAPADYLEFVCIEAALADRAQQLLPGQCWRGTQQYRISDESRSA